MSFQVELWLLVTLSAVAADYSSYTPQLTNAPLPGRVTGTTLILDKPQCLFKNSTNTVWIFVAGSKVQLANIKPTISAPYSSFNSLGYYRTLGVAENTYTCNNVPDYIRVGSETFCSDPNNCNGNLTAPGPYRIAFVILDSNNNYVGQTGWSAPITLLQGKDSSAIDTWPGGRSGGMIVLTSILSILLATFLLCLIGTFIVGRENIICCKSTETVEKSVPQELDMKDYKTHIAPENPEYAEPNA